MAAMSAPEFCKRKAEVTLMSLAVDDGEDCSIIDLIHPAMVQVAAGVWGPVVIRKMQLFWSSEIRQDSVLSKREDNVVNGHKSGSSG